MREHFVFWQQYKESDEAVRYMTFYKISDWPYIAIIDPRTGREREREGSCFYIFQQLN